MLRDVLSHWLMHLYHPSGQNDLFVKHEKEEMGCSQVQISAGLAHPSEFRDQQSTKSPQEVLK